MPLFLTTISNRHTPAAEQPPFTAFFVTSRLGFGGTGGTGGSGGVPAFTQTPDGSTLGGWPGMKAGLIRAQFDTASQVVPCRFVSVYSSETDWPGRMVVGGCMHMVGVAAG